MFTREFHNRVEPVPECEISFGKGLFAELSPWDLHGIVLIALHPRKFRQTCRKTFQNISLTRNQITSVGFETHLNNFSAKYLMLSLDNCLPVTAVNFKLSAVATLPQYTLSGTTNGFLSGSAKALSQVMVAHAWGSWLPWTITVTGNENAHT